jgi:iron complex transport system ATP-binding protein
MISARGLSVSIGGKRILHDVSIEAMPAAVTAIIGPNGSGKTTLLKALSGELAHTGMASISGRPLAGLKPWQMAAMRAVLPQATTLSFPFTVREVVGLGLTNARPGILPGEEHNLPERALSRVGMAGYGGRLYQELSGGEQQRVQLARVLCQVWAPVFEGEPRYLLLDEPVSNLDIKHQLAIMRIAREFAGRGGGVVAVLHDLNLTAMFADHVVAMHRGRVSAAGPAADLLTDDLLETVFECALKVGVPPAGGTPFVLPQSIAG